jgi:hypothetical protein
MSTKILYSLTDWLLRILKTRGVDISQLNPKTKIEFEFESAKNVLIDLQGEISIKRAEIIDNQRDLLAMVEPTLFSTLSNSKDGWEKNTVTKLWFDKLKEINDLVNEHQTLLKEFEDTYIKIENLKR